MSIPEYVKVVQQIIDNLVLFGSKEEAGDVSKGKRTPRLGFDFTPLTIRVRINKSTGRMSQRTFSDEPVVVQTPLPSFGKSVLQELAKALMVRLRKRDPLGTGQNVMLQVPSQDGGGFVTISPQEGILTINLPALKKETDLLQHKDSLLTEDVKRQMAEMWACTQFTKDFKRCDDPREFGLAYWTDRNGGLHRIFEDRFQVSGRRDESTGITQIDMVCGPGNHPSGVALGTVHTHPDAPDFSDADGILINSGNCGSQHFIVTENEVRFLSPGQEKSTSLGSRTSVLPTVTKCDSTNFLDAKPPVCADNENNQF
jgi:hypothetical protein